jgi:hypothetical protein
MTIWDDIWLRANEEEHGLALEFDPEDMKKAQAELYRARGTKFQHMRVCLPGEVNEIWLVRDTVEISNG